MKKLKAFFYVFYKSLTSFEYYKDILETNFSFSIKYLSVLALVATVVNTSITSTMEIPKIQNNLQTLKNTLIEIYPENFEFKVENGEWNINESEPFVIEIPKYEGDLYGQLPKNLVIFDKNGTISDFESKDTLIMLNSTNMLIKNQSGYDVMSLSDLPNGTLTKQVFTQSINQFDYIARYIPIAFVIATALFLYFYYFIYRLLYLVFVAATLFVVNMFFKPDIEFKHLYRISLHAMTAPLLIDLTLRVLNVQMFTVVPWFFILNVVIGTFVMITAAKIND